MKIYRAALGASLLCCAATVTLAAGTGLDHDQIAQVLANGGVATPPPEVIAAPGSSVDVTGVAGVTAQWLIWIVGASALALVQRNVKDKQARDTLSAAILNGVNYDFNMVPGALKGHTLAIDVGSKVAAHALRYVLDAGGAEAKRLDLQPADLAKRIIARIPNMDGETSDAIVHQVAAAAAGAPPPLDASKAIELIGPLADRLAGRLVPYIADHLEKTALARNGAAAVADHRQDSSAAEAAPPPPQVAPAAAAS